MATDSSYSSSHNHESGEWVPTRLVSPMGPWCSNFHDYGRKGISNHTVGGRNPAPVDMVNIPLFTGFHTCLVVQDFFHQQYLRSLKIAFSPFFPAPSCLKHTHPQEVCLCVCFFLPSFHQIAIFSSKIPPRNVWSANITAFKSHDLKLHRVDVGTFLFLGIWWENSLTHRIHGMIVYLPTWKPVKIAGLV